MSFNKNAAKMMLNYLQQTHRVGFILRGKNFELDKSSDQAFCESLVLTIVKVRDSFSDDVRKTKDAFTGSKHYFANISHPSDQLKTNAEKVKGKYFESGSPNGQRAMKMLEYFFEYANNNTIEALYNNLQQQKSSSRETALVNKDAILVNAVNDIFSIKITKVDLRKPQNITDKIVQKHGKKAPKIIKDTKAEFLVLENELSKVKNTQGKDAQNRTFEKRGAAKHFVTVDIFKHFYDNILLKISSREVSSKMIAEGSQLDAKQMKMMKKTLSRFFSKHQRGISSAEGVEQIINELSTAHTSMLNIIKTKIQVFKPSGKEDIYQDTMRYILRTVKANIEQRIEGSKSLGVDPNALQESGGMDTSKPVVKKHGQENTRQRRSGHGSSGGDITWGKKGGGGFLGKWLGGDKEERRPSGDMVSLRTGRAVEEEIHTSV